MKAELDADQVREVVLFDHRRLREQIGQVQAALKRSDRLAISWSLSLLLQDLRTHLDLEDRLLEPTLRRIDAWGPVRAQRLCDEHAAQRAEFDALDQLLQLEDCSLLTLCERVTIFIDALMRDMEHEEREVLDVNLLSDDPQAVNVFTG